MGDLRGSFAGALSTARIKTGRAFYGAVMRVEAAQRGVVLGGDCSFFGRTRLRRCAGSRMEIGEGCHFRSTWWSNLAGVDRHCLLSTLRPGAVLRIGSLCGLSGTVVAVAESVVIGDRVLCGANSVITDTDWHGLDPENRDDARSAPIIIGDDVWIGASAIVLKGVTIGRGTVVAAGSVVTRSLPPMVLAGGNPAVVIRELEQTGGPEGPHEQAGAQEGQQHD